MQMKNALHGRESFRRIIKTKKKIIKLIQEKGTKAYDEKPIQIQTVKVNISGCKL